MGHMAHSSILTGQWNSPDSTVPSTPEGVEQHRVELAAVAATAESAASASTVSTQGEQEESPPAVELQSSASEIERHKAEVRSVQQTNKQKVASRVSNLSLTARVSFLSRSAELYNALRNPCHQLMAFVDLLDNSPTFAGLLEEREVLASLRQAASKIKAIVIGEDTT